MTITMDMLVSEILAEYPEAAAVFEHHGVHVELECAGVLDNPLDLCETMCGISDMNALINDLQKLTQTR